MNEGQEPSDRKAPGFWFYPADYERDMQLLPMAAQGLWMRMLCWMSENEMHRGFLELPTGAPMTEQDIARRAGIGVKETNRLLACMERIGTFSRDERGCLLSRRMARDTHISVVRRQAAIKRLNAVERAKHGEFAPAKPPAKAEQTPSVTASVTDSVTDYTSGQSSSRPKKQNQNGNSKTVTTTDDKQKFVTPKDELIALMQETTKRTPEVGVVRKICEAIETRGGNLPEYMADIRPRIERLRDPPAEGFFLSQAKKWGSSETTPAPQPELVEAKNGNGRCVKCNGVGLVEGKYCTCRMGRDLNAIEARKKKPQQPQTEAS